MSSRRRPRRSRAWRAALPASSPRSIGITSGSDQKQNTPLQSRSSFPSSSSDDGGGEEEEEHRFGDSAEFRLDRIPTSSSSSADLAVTPALARSQTYRGAPNSGRSGGRSSSDERASAEKYYSPSSIPSATRKRLGHERISPARSPSKGDSGSPSHGAMGAAFHSVLVNRITRTHQGGKNMGARAMIKIIRKHMIKQKWKQWHLHVREQRLAIHVEIRTLTDLWGGWKIFTHREIQKKVMLRRLMSRKERRCLTSGVRHWTLGAKDRQIMILRQQIAELRPSIEEQCRKERERVVRRVIGRFVHRTLSQSLSTWCQVHRTELHNEHVVRTITQRMHMRQETAAFNSWYCHIRQQIRSREIVRRSVGRIRHQTLGKTMLRWHEQTQKRVRAKAIIKKTINQSARAGRQTTLRRGFRRLLDHVRASTINESEELRFRAVALRFISVLRHHLLQKGWITWLFCTREMKKVEQMRRRAVKRWSNQLLRRAVSTWSYNIREMQRMQRIMIRASSRMKNIKLSKALSTWCIFVSKRKSLRKRVRVMVHRWASSQYVAGWSTWHQHIKLSRAAEIALARDELQLTIKEERKSNILRRVVQRMDNKVMSIGLATWSAHTVELLRLESRKRHILLRIQNRVISRSFCTWYDKIAKTKRHRHIMYRCRQRVLHRCQSKAFEQWSDMCHRMQSARTILHRVSARAQRQRNAMSITRSFRLWCLFTDRDRLNEMSTEDKQRELGRRRQVLRRCFVRMQKRRITAGLSTWRTYVQLQRLDQERKSRAASKWKRMEIHRGFQKWKHVVQARKEQRHRMARVINRMQHGKMHRCLQSWLQVTEQRRALRRRMQVTAQRWEQQNLLVGFRTWQLKLQHDRNAKTKLDREQDKVRAAEERRRHELQRILFRMTNRATSRALRQWCSEVQHQKKEEIILTRTMFKMQKRTETRCLQRWVASTSEIKRLRYISRKVVVRIQKRNVSICFETWYQKMLDRNRARSFLKRMHSKKERDETRDRQTTSFHRWRYVTSQLALYSMNEKSRAMELERRRCLLSRVMTHFSKREMHQSLFTWSQNVKEQREEENRKKHALRHWVNRLMWSSFTQWNHEVLQRIRSHRILTRCAGRIRHSHFASAFSAWCALVQRRSCARKEMRQILSRMKKACLSTGWRTWSLYVMKVQSMEQEKDIIAEREEREEEIRKMSLSRTVNRICRRKLFVGLSTWRKAVVHMKRVERLSNNALRRWSSGVLHRAILTWRITVRRIITEKNALKRVHARWTLHVQSSAFHQWWSISNKRKYVRDLIIKILKRSAREKNAGKKRRGLRRWCQFVDTLQLEDMDDEMRQVVLERRKLRMRAVVLRAIKRRTTSGWRSWQNYVRLKQEEEQNLHRAVLRWTRTTMCRCMNTWSSNIATTIRNRHLLTRAIGRIQHRRVAATFDEWYIYVQGKMEQRCRVQRIVSRWLKGQLTATFRTWYKMVVRAIDLERSKTLEGNDRIVLESEHLRQVILTKFLKKISRRDISIGFQTWKYECLVVGHERMVKRDKICARMLRRALYKSWLAWRSMVKEKKGQRHTMQRILGKMIHRKKTIVLSEWQDKVNERLWLRSVVVRALNRAEVSTIRQLWSRWCRFVRWDIMTFTEKEQQCHAMQRILSRMKKSSLYCVWNQWNAMVHHDRNKERKMKRATLRWKNKLVNRCISTWRADVANSLRVRMVVKRALARVVFRQRSLCFNAWYDAILNIQHQRLKMSQMIHRWEHAHVDSAFRTWVNNDRRHAQHLYRDELDEAQRLTVRQKEYYEETRCVLFFYFRFDI